MNRVARKDSDALNKQRTVSGNFSGGGGSTYASSESGGSFVSEMSSTSTFLEHADEFGISKREVKRTLSKSEKYQVQWVPDSVVTGCQVCAKTFTSLRRKHHCRVCGRIVCSACSKRRMKVENTKYKKRTCDRCAEIMICMKEQFQPQKEGPQQQQNGLQEPQKELQEILKLDRQADKKNIQQDQKCFIIDRLWLQSWLDYATKRATKRPGPVTNFELVNFVQGELYPKSDLKLQNGKRGHFRHVNEDVWLKYIEWYGGGPAIWVIGPDVENTEMWKIQLNLKDDAHPLNSALNEFALKTLSKQLDNVAEENIDDPMSRHFFNILNDPRSAKAASSIQRIFRGKLARKRILLLRAAVLNKHITAALTIQRVRRGQICRRSLNNPPVHLKGNDFYDDDGNFRRKKNDEIDIRLSSVEMEKLQSHEVSEGRLEKMSSWYNSRGEKTNEERVLHSRLSIEERSALEKFESNIGLDDDEHDEIQLLKGKDRPSCFGFRLFCC